MPDWADHQRLAHVTLDAATMGAGTHEQMRERHVAIADLVEVSRFAVPGHGGGPYGLRLAIHDAKLAFDVRTAAGEPIAVHLLSLRSLRGLVRDYKLIVESHGAAVRGASAAQIEAIDMGRRGLHDEAAERLAERLKGKIETDFPTMRRLFTLLTALHWQG